MRHGHHVPLQLIAGLLRHRGEAGASCCGCCVFLRLLRFTAGLLRQVPKEDLELARERAEAAARALRAEAEALRRTVEASVRLVAVVAAVASTYCSYCGPLRLIAV